MGNGDGVAIDRIVVLGADRVGAGTMRDGARLAMGDQLLVAPMRWSENEYGLVGVLDLTTGAWTTHQIEFSADTQARVDGYFDAGWDVRTDGSVVMLAPSQVQRGTGADPSAVYDPASRTWSTPTADDVDTWRRFPTIYGSENF